MCLTPSIFSDRNGPTPPVDAAVRKIEDAYTQSAISGVSQLADRTSKLSLAVDSKVLKFPARPGYGTQGTKFVVCANYFKISSISEDIVLFRYNIEVQPEAKGKKLKRIFELLLEDPRFAGVATEYKSMVISSKRLDVPAQIDLEYRSELDDAPKEGAPVYQVRVLPTAQLSVSELVQNLSGINQAHYPSKFEIIQALNVVLGNFAQRQPDVVTYKSGNTTNNHYSVNQGPENSHNRSPLGDGLVTLRGFFQSVRPATGGLLLNVNVHHGVFLQPGHLVSLYEIIGKNGRDPHGLEKALKRARVQLTHLEKKISKSTKKEIPRIRTIFGFAKMSDGRHGDNLKPRIRVNNAGPNDVQFWFDPARGVIANGPKTAGWVSVYQWFNKSKSPFFRFSLDNTK